MNTCDETPVHSVTSQGIPAEEVLTLCDEVEDTSLPPLFLRVHWRFCRVSVRTIQTLDLRRKLPHLDTALLLRFPGGDPFSSRRKDQRVGYAFCPLCVANQDVIHVGWRGALRACFDAAFSAYRYQSFVPLAGKVTFLASVRMS
jgi:hypothetical protein